MEVSFIGTGLMGTPMAERLIAAGNRVTVFVGSSPAVFDRWADLLRVFGSEVVRVGDVGQAAELMLKDLHLIRDEAASLGLRLDGLDGIIGLVLRTVESGHGRDDYSSLYEIVDPAS